LKSGGWWRQKAGFSRARFLKKDLKDFGHRNHLI
jgi:hypothetical protein